MGIALRNCSLVRIGDLAITDTGGDGIYIGRNHYGRASAEAQSHRLRRTHTACASHPQCPRESRKL
jgi:hypothetical protein